MTDEKISLNKIFGFFYEVKRKYGSSEAWEMLMDLFDYFPIGALVEGKVFCVSAGLSPEMKTLDQIRTLDRKKEIPNEGPFCDLVWSDADNGIEGWGISPRGAGYLFGEDVVKEFNFMNNLELIARGHQLVMTGYEFPFGNDSLVTVWSAPNYKQRCGNLGAVMKIDEDLEREFTCLKELP